MHVQQWYFEFRPMRLQLFQKWMVHALINVKRKFLSNLCHLYYIDDGYRRIKAINWTIQFGVFENGYFKTLFM